MTPAEFAAVYRAEVSYVWKSLKRLGVPTADLDDLTQEVFVTAFQRFDTYDSRRPLRPWLFGIAFRVASALRQRASTRREVGGVAPTEPLDSGPTPLQVVENLQKRERVLRALDTLRLERKAVFILADIEGQSVPEVAEALSVPLNTAYTRLRAARADFTRAYRQTAEDTR